MAGQVYEILARQLLDRFAPPLTISVLETPAGFEVNAERVAGRVADFFTTRLQNYHPQIQLIPARKKGTSFSPDAPEVVEPLYHSQMIFFGPGSPTYTVRQLDNSLAWSILQARHRLGADLVLASAAIVSLSALALPVYEIYKVGEDIHWKPGLDFFKPYGLSLAIIPHWNNNEGGDEVDTSRCFMGRERFSRLQEMLPPDMVLLGIDEHSALPIALEANTCFVRGVGQVHIIKGAGVQECAAGCSFSIYDLGEYHPLDDPAQGLPEPVWQRAIAIQQAGRQQDLPDSAIPNEVWQLVNQRQAARQSKDWALADQIRDRIRGMGWELKDTNDGPVIERILAR
jgi:hypothetical protein